MEIKPIMMIPVGAETYQPPEFGKETPLSARLSLILETTLFFGAA